jgi:hypothetical protein
MLNQRATPRAFILSAGRAGAGRVEGRAFAFWNQERETAAAFGKGAGKQSFSVSA